MKCPNCNTYIFTQTRTTPENRYFHGVVLQMLSDHTGHSIDEMRDLVKSMFLKDTINLERDGKVFECSIVRGSSGLTTVEFERFMEDIRRWAATYLKLSIPEPKERVK